MKEMASKTSDAIKVFIRIRPPNDVVGSDKCMDVLSNTSLIIHSKPTPKQFTFDHVADENTTQSMMFEKVGKPIVEGCLQGYNGTIFAYGQTGSGKTYTMLGSNEEFYGKDKGLIPRTLSLLFELISKKSKQMDSRDFQSIIKCSFIEIYNEQTYDLLEPKRKLPLQIREDFDHSVFIESLTIQSVDSLNESLRVLNRGWRNRNVAATTMNRESSRGHAVFTVTIETKEREGDLMKIRKSCLNLVDLAGSERQKDAQTTGLRLREAGNINKSLSVFGNVIMCLVNMSKGKARHIPYRDSKLTFLLRDSLGGNSRTCIITNVHPGSNYFGETLSSLQFAQRAKLILNKVSVNENSEGNITALQIENQMLKSLLEKQKSVSNTSQGRDYEEIFLQAVSLWHLDNKKITDLTKRLESADSTKIKLNRMINFLKRLLKFRNIEIVKLKKGLPKDESDFKQIQEENLLLNQKLQENMEDNQHLEMIKDLKRSIQNLSNIPSVESFNQFSEQRKEEIFQEFCKLKSLKDELKESDDEKEADSTRLAEFEAQNQKLREKLKTQEEINQKELTKNQLQINELESQLAGSRKQCSELDKLLSQVRKQAKIHSLQRESIFQSAFIRANSPQISKVRKSILPNAVGKGPPILLKGLNDRNDEIEAQKSFMNSFVPASEIFLGKDENEEKKLHELEKTHLKLVEDHTSLQCQIDFFKKIKKDQEEEINNLKASKESEEAALQKKLESRLEELRNFKIVLGSKDKEIQDTKLELTKIKNLYEEDSKARSELLQLRSDHEDISEEVMKLKAELMRVESDVETAEEEKRFLRDQLEDHQKKIVSLEKDCEGWKIQMEVLRLEMNARDVENEKSICDENHRLNVELQTISKIKEDLEKKIDDTLSEVDDLKKIIESKDKNISILNERNIFVEEESKNFHLLNSDLQKEILETKTSLDAITQENDRLFAENENLMKNEKQMKEEISKYKFLQENTQDDLLSYNQMYEDLEKENEVEKEKLKSVNEKFFQLHKDFEDLKQAHQKEKEKLKKDRVENSPPTESLSIEEFLCKDLEQKDEHIEELQNNLDEIVANYQEARERIKQFEEEKQSHVSELKARDAKHLQELEVIRNELLTTQQSKVNDFEHTLDEVMKINEKLNQEISHLKDNEKEKIEETNLLKLLHGEKLHQIEKMQNQLNTQKEQLHLAEQQLFKEQKCCEDLKTRVSELAGNNNIQQRIKHLQMIKSESAELSNENNRLNREIAKLKRKIQQLEAGKF